MLRFPLGTGTSGFFARSALGAASIVRPRHARMNAVEIRLATAGHGDFVQMRLLV